MAVMKKKIKLVSPVRCRQVSEGGSFLPFQMAGMRKTTKEKIPKNESGSF